MFEVGFTEILLISVLALIVLGPEKLPRVAAQVGRWMGRARAMARQFREQLEEEVQTAEAQKTKPPEVRPVQPESSAAAGAAGATAEATSNESAPPPMYTDSTAGGSAHTEPSSDHTSHYAADHVSGSPEYNAAAETAHAENASAPAPEPEAPEYQPPAYAQAPKANGESGAAAPSAVESPASHPSEEPSRRPGDFITHTHERGI